MTKTIEEVKTAKCELESKISQMVNEFSKEYNCQFNIDIRNTGNQIIGQENPVYYCTIGIKI